MSEVKMSIDEKNTNNITIDSSVNSVNTTLSEINNLKLEKDNYIKQEQIKQINKMKEEAIHMVCRQSELSYEEAKIELEKYNYNYMNVLNNYHNINNNINNNNNNNNKNKSINQNIYSEIRNFMDTGAKTVRINHERNEILKQNNKSN
jgi:cephalosporin hydroxylase